MLFFVSRSYHGLKFCDHLLFSNKFCQFLPLSVFLHLKGNCHQYSISFFCIAVAFVIDITRTEVLKFDLLKTPVNIPWSRKFEPATV